MIKKFLEYRKRIIDEQERMNNTIEREMIIYSQHNKNNIVLCDDFLDAFNQCSMGGRDSIVQSIGQVFRAHLKGVLDKKVAPKKLSMVIPCPVDQSFNGLPSGEDSQEGENKMYHCVPLCQLMEEVNAVFGLKKLSDMSFVCGQSDLAVQFWKNVNDIKPFARLELDKIAGMTRIVAINPDL